MDLQLQNKTVIVTGGAKGIGAAAVESFAAEGTNVTIAGRSPTEGQSDDVWKTLCHAVLSSNEFLYLN